MINPFTNYPGKLIAPNASYPFGQPRDVVVTGDATGTPWESAWINDFIGLQAALSLGKDTPGASGNPETRLLSDMMEGFNGFYGCEQTHGTTSGHITFKLDPYLNRNAGVPPTFVINYGVRGPTEGQSGTETFSKAFVTDLLVGFAISSSTNKARFIDTGSLTSCTIRTGFNDQAFWMAIGV